MTEVDRGIVLATRPLPATMDTTSTDVATATSKMLQSGVSGGSMQYLNPDYMPPSVSSTPFCYMMTCLGYF